LNIYASTKLALVRWLRRTAPSWAARGVNLNALAPGAVDTTIMPDTQEYRDGFESFIMGMAMPAVYGEHRMMYAEEVGPALAALTLPDFKGVCGAVLYCDGGTSAVLHPEKFY
jgi:NAD(P)-dependent dehydrogenase (short-subunit alcohol dehydrogenase family)